MPKIVVLLIAFMLLLPSVNAESVKFSEYNKMEAYEVRPGILMIPSYSADGQVCKIGLQKLHYSPKIVRSEAELSYEEINEIFEELVPSSERGPRSKGFPEGLIVQEGASIVTSETYENVTLQIYEFELPGSKRGKTLVKTIAAVMRWNNRKCQ
jgi:hypothetical protein